MRNKKRFNDDSLNENVGLSNQDSGEQVEVYGAGRMLRDIIRDVDTNGPFVIYGTGKDAEIGLNGSSRRNKASNID